jgi:peroxiredoxin
MGDSRWTRHLLTLVGIYYLFSGLFNAIFPKIAFKVANVAIPEHIFLWQQTSLIVVVFGFGFLIASSNPTRHWPILFMGLLKMVISVIGCGMLVYLGSLNMIIGLHILLTDGIWIIPIFAALRWTFNQNNQVEESLNYFVEEEREINLENITDQHGVLLDETIEGKPILFVFLRQLGCIFCRETLTVLQKEHKLVEKLGTKLVIVHISDDEDNVNSTFESFGLNHISRVRDIDLRLYNQFGLEKGETKQLFNIKTFLRMLDILIFKGITQGKTNGDVTQMPGAFLVVDGQVINAFKHETAADNPDYIRLAAVPEY